MLGILTHPECAGCTALKVHSMYVLYIASTTFLHCTAVVSLNQHAGIIRLRQLLLGSWQYRERRKKEETSYQQDRTGTSGGSDT